MCVDEVRVEEATSDGVHFNLTQLEHRCS